MGVEGRQAHPCAFSCGRGVRRSAGSTADLTIDNCQPCALPKARLPFPAPSSQRDAFYKPLPFGKGYAFNVGCSSSQKIFAAQIFFGSLCILKKGNGSRRARCPKRDSRCKNFIGALFVYMRKRGNGVEGGGAAPKKSSMGKSGFQHIEKFSTFST